MFEKDYLLKEVRLLIELLGNTFSDGKGGFVTDVRL